MRVLWILNLVLPKVASEINIKSSFSGSWLIDYAEKLSKDSNIELATMTYANVDKFYDITVDNIRNFVFPGGGKRLLFNSKKTIDDCQKVIDEFKPDLIHIHGTEYSMGYSMIKTGTKIPMLLTIQGILKRIYEEYYGGISLPRILKMGTLKEWTKLKTQFIARQMYRKNAKRESFVLKNVKYVTGRTLWDKVVMQSINPDLKYFRLNYNLRDEFYNAASWDASKMQPHTIYTCATSYPLKGLHVLLKAVAIVKKEYPDTKVFVIGGNIMKKKKPSGYEKYIKKMIIELGIEENIEFIGNKKSQEVVEMLQKVNICIAPSSIEGASATIREAMMIGTPCICSYRGGMTDLLRDGESGFFYDFPEYGVLAERIKQLFSDPALCEKFSKNEIEDAKIRHDREKNYSELIQVYNEVAKNN